MRWKCPGCRTYNTPGEIQCKGCRRLAPWQVLVPYTLLLGAMSGIFGAALALAFITLLDGLGG